MHLSDYDLRQMNEDWLVNLPEAKLRQVSARMLLDLKEARDRLNQSPDNSSRPPSSRAPWERGQTEEKPSTSAAAKKVSTSDEVVGEPQTDPQTEESTVESEPALAELPTDQKNKPGKQPGAIGYGRVQTFAITGTVSHRAKCCAACEDALPDNAPSQIYAAWDEIDVNVLPSGGLEVTCVRHMLLDITGDCCGHTTRTQPYRAEADGLWGKVEISQWRLIGPTLAAIIVMLSLRMRLSRSRIRELVDELFGITLSIGVIDQTIRETGRACDPLEAVLLEEIEQAALVHADETGWPEGKNLQWLWVLLSASTVLYFIGPRTQEMMLNALGENFGGVLMADGYKVYRTWLNRLRCWAHLLRKARGLEESTDGRVSEAGGKILALLTLLIEAILSARENPPFEPLVVLHKQDIRYLRELCEQHRNDPHKKLRELAAEFLYDWDVILRQVSEPNLPLTNNPAESALRPMVIARNISHGTRCPSGSRAYALLASVIETCRLRKASSWHYLAEVIQAARLGAPLPDMPPAPSIC
jgi:transposase